MNAIKTTLLLGLMSGIILLAGSRFGEQGLVYALIAAIGMNFFTYFFSAKMALWSTGAQPVSESEHPEVYQRIFPIIQGLTQRMGLPMPKLYVTPEPSPNAFATGRNSQNSVLCVTEGLLRRE